MPPSETHRQLLAIPQIIVNHTPKRKKDKPKSIHLVGTDRPEATMIYAGFFTEILAANPLNPIKMTLVSPDPANRQLAQDCSPNSPMLIHQRCKLTAWDGLYHDFWERYIELFLAILSLQRASSWLALL